MSYLEKYNTKAYSAFAWVIFGLLMIYLLLRAYFLEPLHDEVATFFYYIESGIYWGPDLMLDANNHLLNSMLGHWIYLLFGDNFFFIRLPNVLAFVFYFWGIYRFIKPIPSNIHKTLILLGTTCIPFILEYFAYTRGYGISMGLFIFSLSYIRDFIKNRNVKSAHWASLLLCLTVYSNLNFLLSLILMVALFGLIQWMHKEEFTKKQHSYLFLNYFLLGFSMLPNLYHAHLLRANGALYYGSLDGFWNVTGKTLAENIIFHNLVWVKYASIAVILLLTYYLIRRWLKLRAKTFFTKSSTLLAWFLFGNCVAIILMAKLLHVNYPEDRVGMHLAILFILLLGFIISEVKSLNWLMIGMLFFPIVMIPKINLTTSVFSPDNRMTKEFFQDVSENLDSYSSVSFYPLQQLIYYYHARYLGSNNFASVERAFNHTSDVVITKTTLFKDQDYLKNYDIIADDPESTFIAYKKKTPSKKNIIYDKPLNIIDAQDEYISIYQAVIPDSLRNRKLQFHVDGDIVAENIYREFAVFVYSTLNEDEKTTNYKYVNERWRQGTVKEFPLNFNYAVDELKKEENEIRIYIWNQKREKISLTNGVFQILELED